MKSEELLRVINKKYEDIIKSLGEGLIISWWLMLLLEFYRPGMVSTIWDLNLILVVALLCLVVGIILNHPTTLPYSFVSLLSAIIITVIIWNLQADPFIKMAAPVIGLLTWLIFRNYD